MFYVLTYVCDIHLRLRVILLFRFWDNKLLYKYLHFIKHCNNCMSMVRIFASLLYILRIIVCKHLKFTFR